MVKDNVRRAKIPSREEMERYLEYNPKSGYFYWKCDRGRAKRGGKAGKLDSRGYYQIKIFGKLLFAHRLAFVFMGEECPDYVDHANGNPLDNRWENLRACTRQENNRNARIRRDNTSGVKNVGWDKSINKWFVRLTINKRLRYFGSYDDLDLAELVAHEVRQKYFGQFARDK